MRRRHLVLAALAVVALAVSVPVGRWQEHRANAAQARGVEAVLAATGDPIASPLRDAYRRTWTADCLLYRSGKDPFALELCFDSHGRLVDAIDRRSGSPKISSFRPQPTASSLRIDPRRLYAVLQAAGAFPPSAHYPGSLPLHTSPGAPRYRGFAAVIVAINDDFGIGTLHSGRLTGTLACLSYGAPTQRDADLLEVCFDRDGNVVRTTDRRYGTPIVSTLTRDPGQQRYRVAVVPLLRLLREQQVLPGVATLVDGRLPLVDMGGG